MASINWSETISREGKCHGSPFLCFPVLRNRHSSINGRWELEATHRDGALDVLCMDWATFQEALAGGPDTDYRFAWINGGTFDRRHVGLEVQYIDVIIFSKATLKKVNSGAPGCARTMRMEAYGRHPPSERSLKIFRVGKCSALANQSLLTESFGLFTSGRSIRKRAGMGMEALITSRNGRSTNLTRNACKPSG